MIKECELVETTCRRCGRETEWDPSLGDTPLCQECWDNHDTAERRAYRRAYYLLNRTRENTREMEYYRRNRSHCVSLMKRWYQWNKRYRAEYMRQYRQGVSR